MQLSMDEIRSRVAIAAADLAAADEAVTRTRALAGISDTQADAEALRRAQARRAEAADRLETAEAGAREAERLDAARVAAVRAAAVAVAVEEARAHASAASALHEEAHTYFLGVLAAVEELDSKFKASNRRADELQQRGATPRRLHAPSWYAKSWDVLLPALRHLEAMYSR